MIGWVVGVNHLWVYLKDINRRAIIVVFPVDTTCGKEGLQLDNLSRIDWKFCMKNHALLCNCLVVLLNLVQVKFLR